METIFGTGRRSLGWGIFNRRSGEISTGVDTKKRRPAGTPPGREPSEDSPVFDGTPWCAWSGMMTQ